MNIGHQLCILLKEKGITQKKLAQTLHLSPSTLNGYVKNRRKPDANTLVRLASYFNTTTDYIYGISSLREPPGSPYNAEERRLIHIFRAMPEDKRALFIETGELFSGREETVAVKEKEVRSKKQRK